MKRFLMILMAFVITTVSSAAFAAFKQIPLSEAKVEALIAAQEEINGLIEAGELDEDSFSTPVKLEQIAAKHGFSSFDELEDVAENVAFVLSGLDDEGVFTDPVDLLKAELEKLKADTTLPEADKKTLIQELTEGLSSLERLKYEQNVAIVKKYRTQIEEASL